MLNNFNPSSSPVEEATVSHTHFKMFITRAELARALSVSISSIDRGIKAGTLPCRPIRIGRRVLFPTSCLESLSAKGGVL